MSLNIGIALMGGTFDPVHRGHIASASELASLLPVDHVQLLPCHIPPHRNTPLCSAEQRLKLLEAAVEDEPGLVVNGLELQRAEPSYTVETLRELRQQYPQQALFWVMGSDAFNQLESWYQWQDLLELAHVVVMDRAEQPLSLTPALERLWQQRHIALPEADIADLAGCIFSVQLSPWPVSATKIRTALVAGDSETAKQGLPAKVWQTIRDQGLYAQ